MTAPARTAAFHALRAVMTRRADLPAALAGSRQFLHDERDRALAAEIVTGTLRWLRSLDYLIERIATRPVGRIDAEVLIILRLSAYQILHLDRVPAAAVVDDAVDLTRSARKPGAAGFVNAVLRTLLRQRHRLPLPPRPVDPADREAALAYLGIAHSHPEWLVARWLARYGFHAAERWVQFNNETPPLTLRANTLRASREQVRAALAADGIETEPTPFAPDGLVVRSGNPLQRPLDGSFVVQDEASQVVPIAVAARPGERVLDLCASPGGKTLVLAAAMRDVGMVVASDIRVRRVNLLRETIRLSGARSVRVLHVDDSGPLPFRPVFDRILVDAPCSGLGVVRRDPDIKWRRSEADLKDFAAAQVSLLLRAAAVLKPGGRLVYATCSSEPDENEHVVAAFLEQQPMFARVNLRSEPGAVSLRLIDAEGYLRTLPFEHGLEAFFAAALTRKWGRESCSGDTRVPGT